MSVAKQLYQLQEVDLEIESNEQTLQRLNSQLGENRVLVETQTRLTSEQRRLDELKHQQHSAEWEIDDLVSKITTTEEQLYSGRIKNPKELTNLQHEVELLKAKRDQLENRALEIMGQVELAEANVATTGSEFNKLEAEWHRQQQQLSVEIEALKSKLSVLGQKRQLISGEIEPQAVAVYDKLRKQKGQAVAKVEQGICRGCRISLPSSELQQVRSGNLVQCSSCGRILFLP
ncbi:MAG: zinc ribbon domain-containing protein [Dehalococcoidales bacterium]